MAFALLDSLSLPGDAAKPNEDFFAQDGNAAVVLDGATPLGESLMPGPSDAAWIARFGGRRLLARLREGAAPRAALKKALGDTQKSFAALRRRPAEAKWQIPCASMMLVTQVQGGLDFLWLGDCAALWMKGDTAQIVGHTLAAKAAEAARARAVTKDMPPAFDLNRARVLDHLRASRARIGSGDNWLFAPDPDAAAHAARARVAAAPGDHILLASDGFLALISDYGAYDAAGLMAAAAAKGLAALGAELRAIEENDPLGARFPRFKKSDDATALLLKLA